MVTEYEPKPAGARKAYSSPNLIDYGSVASLTRGTFSSRRDDGQGTGCSTPDPVKRCTN